jgi:hypothetical protein
MFGSFSYVHFLFYVLPFVLWFFVYKSELRLKVRHFILHLPIIKEITALSFVIFSRQECEYHTQPLHTFTGRTFHRRLRIISREC